MFLAAALCLVFLLAVLSALYVWTRRMERDVDYSALHAAEPDKGLRSTAQLAIGLSTTQQSWGG